MVLGLDLVLTSSDVFPKDHVTQPELFPDMQEDVSEEEELVPPKLRPEDYRAPKQKAGQAGYPDEVNRPGLDKEKKVDIVTDQIMEMLL